MANSNKGPKGIAVVIGIGHPRGSAPMMTPQDRQRHAADVEAAFTGRPQPHGTFDAANDGGRVAAETAGYMELDAAQKSGDCDLVDVPDGVSGEKGCCNLFDPQQGAGEFECEQCEHFQGQSQGAAAGAGSTQQGEAMNG